MGRNLESLVMWLFREFYIKNQPLVVQPKSINAILLHFSFISMSGSVHLSWHDTFVPVTVWTYWSNFCTQIFQGWPSHIYLFVGKFTDCGHIKKCFFFFFLAPQFGFLTEQKSFFQECERQRCHFDLRQIFSLWFPTELCTTSAG